MKALVLFILLGAYLTATAQQNERESLFNGKNPFGVDGTMSTAGLVIKHFGSLTRVLS